MYYNKRNPYYVTSIEGRLLCIQTVEGHQRRFCNTFEIPFVIKADDVASIRPVNDDDLRFAFGPWDEEGIPAVHDDARTIIALKNGDNVYVREDLRDLANKEQLVTRELVSRLSPGSRLILAVAESRPEIVELPSEYGSVCGTATIAPPQASEPTKPTLWQQLRAAATAWRGPGLRPG